MRMCVKIKIMVLLCGCVQALKNGPRSVGAPTRAGAAALGVSPSKLIHRSKSAINPSRGKEAASEAPVGRQGERRALCGGGVGAVVFIEKVWLSQRW